MPLINYADYTITELKTMQSEIDHELDQRLEACRDELISRATQVATELGISPDELLQPAPKKTPRAKAAAKYANPANPTQTWTGRGKQPAWFAEALTNGTTKDAMELSTSEETSERMP